MGKVRLGTIEIEHPMCVCVCVCMCVYMYVCIMHTWAFFSTINSPRSYARGQRKTNDRKREYEYYKGYIRA